MIRTLHPPGAHVESHVLRTELQRALSEHYGHECRVDHIERRPSPYQSTAVLEELDVGLSQGRLLRLMFKRQVVTDRDDGVNARPGFLVDPEREIDVYEAILRPARVPTPRIFGSLVDRSSGRYWLFLERVGGRELCQVGDAEAWTEAARWLARLHDRFCERGQPRYLPVPLLRYDRAYYARWLRRALQFATEERRQAIEGLADHHERAVECLLQLPNTLIHGEFYPSNVLIRSVRGVVEVIPVDWETAAVGPGVLDLAALTAGSWSQDELQPIEESYFETAAASGICPGSRDGFIRGLAAARLHVAIQWLGWSPNWTPPPHHARDWLEDALHISSTEGLT